MLAAEIEAEIKTKRGSDRIQVSSNCGVLRNLNVRLNMCSGSSRTVPGEGSDLCAQDADCNLITAKSFMFAILEILR